MRGVAVAKIQPWCVGPSHWFLRGKILLQAKYRRQDKRRITPSLNDMYR
jgi:hypothetical protein